ncbi:MAG TPA: C25 family cysteine peptidase, partial [Candidatus Krumholzibacteria bacterium]|nr:C25 family cysteine peptidase [Candidatus Krumholzibacteria bacterium]HPD73375.1 C25 family cysteine peptidase [Candidatus Krumholzibacteria bacterium]
MSLRNRVLSAWAIALVFTLPVVAAGATREVLPLEPGPVAATADVRVLDRHAGGMTFELTVRGLAHETISRDGRTFDSLDLEDGGAMGAVGQPTVPTFTRLVPLPAGSGVDVRVVAQQKRSLGTMTLAPMEPTTEQGKAGPDFDAAWYASAPVIEPGVVVGEPALMHGVRVVPITFCPVGYDPATGEVTAASSLTVEVTFGGADQRNDRTGPPRLIPESFATIFEEEVVGFVRDENVAVGPGTYILVCPNNSTVLSIIEELAAWRRRQGYNVIVATTATAGTTNTAIKSWLQVQYNTVKPPLEFVTLVGDANGSVAIPTFNETLSGYGGEGDHDYTLLEGGDVLSDIHIGRISVTTTAELQIAVDKIVGYESDPDFSETNWFTTAGLTGDPNSSSGYSCVLVNQFVKEQLLELGYTRVDTIFSGNFTTQMLATINSGETLFTYRGWLNMSGMTSSHIMSTTNGRQLPYAVIMTCSTGSFQDDANARSEAFLRAPSGGGIAAVGTATSGTHTRYNNCIFLGTTNGVLNSPEHRVGPSLTRGKLNLYRNYYTNEPSQVTIWSVWNNLMGDSATEIYTGVPAAIAVSYPAQVALGANALPVTVTRDGAPLADARVAVYQQNRVQDFAYTDQAGQAVLDIAEATTGDVLVTVTGRNLRPHLGQTAVGAVVRSLDFASLTIQEVSGNGDNVANPGETLDLAVALTNHGTSSVVGAVGVITTPLPYVTVLDGDASYGTVAAGATVSGTYRIRLESDAPGGATPELRLDATGSASTWTSLVALPIRAARGALPSVVFGGPGGTFDPGEVGTVTFTLTNVGDLATAGVTATLSCASQWIT